MAILVTAGREGLPAPSSSPSESDGECFSSDSSSTRTASTSRLLTEDLGAGRPAALGDDECTCEEDGRVTETRAEPLGESDARRMADVRVFS